MQLTGYGVRVPLSALLAPTAPPPPRPAACTRNRSCAERSARYTFPDLQNFRPGRVRSTHTPCHALVPGPSGCVWQSSKPSAPAPALGPGPGPGPAFHYCCPRPPPSLLPCLCCLHVCANQLANWRRVFAHTADVFFKRGIAKPETVRTAGQWPGRAVCVWGGRGHEGTRMGGGRGGAGAWGEGNPWLRMRAGGLDVACVSNAHTAGGGHALREAVQ